MDLRKVSALALALAVCLWSSGQSAIGKSGSIAKSGSLGKSNPVTPPGSYTGQSCSNGLSSGVTGTIACSATITVSAGDIVAVYGTYNTTSETISSCSSATGTASVTWTVVTGAGGSSDSTYGETNAFCYGSVTAGGTVEPRMVWTNSGGGDQSIIAADFSGLIATTDGANTKWNNPGSSSTNGDGSNTVTTTTANDMLIGGTADIVGSAATVTAGTTSVSFTKVACTTAWGGQTCLEYGTQSSPGSGTQAAWTYSNTDNNLTAILAVKP